MEIKDKDFEEIYSKLLKHEGGYTNDPLDSGGETYKGITRKNNPDTPIWSTIDRLKDKPNFESLLDKDSVLQEYVKFFYYELYEKHNIHLLKHKAIKDKVYSTIVNAGSSKGIILLQRCYNILKNSKDLAEDGVLGKGTAESIAVLSDTDAQDLVMFYRAELYIFYKQLVEKRPKDQRFFKGWARRAFS